MRIMVVEDDFLIAGDLELKLNDLGYSEIFIAYDLSEAEKLLATATPDFAILDVNIGGQMVFPIAALLQERKIPFVFSTGNSLNTFPLEWRSHPYIPKPLETELLVATMTGLGLHQQRPAED